MEGVLTTTSGRSNNGSEKSYSCQRKERHFKKHSALFNALLEMAWCVYKARHVILSGARLKLSRSKRQSMPRAAKRILACAIKDNRRNQRVGIQARRAASSAEQTSSFHRRRHARNPRQHRPLIIIENASRDNASARRRRRRGASS